MPGIHPKYHELFYRMKEDVLFMGRLLNPGMFTVRSPYLHTEFQELYLDRSVRQINIIAPRHSAKTSFWGNLAPIHHIFFDAMRSASHDPEPRFFLVISKSLEPHAINLLEDVKMVIEGREFRTMFGDWGEATARTWRQDTIQLKNGSTIMSRGMTTQLRGLKKNNIRPTFIVLDDPEDENNTKTIDAMEGNLKTLLQGLVPALMEPSGRIIVVGTPQNARSMVMELKKATDWNTVYRTCWLPGHEGEESYWPEIWPVKRLLERKSGLESIGRGSVFYREYECKITGDTDQLVKPEDLKWWDGTLISRGKPGESTAWLKITHLGLKELASPIVKAVNVFMGVDPASSTSVRANYSAIVPIAVDRDKNKYVLPYYQKRVTPLVLADAILEHVQRFKPLRTRIETVAFQSMLYEYLSSRDDRIPGLATKENPRDAKKRRAGTEEYGRLDRMQPDFARGKYFLKSKGERESMNELKDELILYPFSDQDDLLDGLFYAQKNAYAPWHGDEELNEAVPRVSRRRKKMVDWMTV